MPPFIYKSARLARNYPHGRAYEFVGGAWLDAEFGSFTGNFVAGQGDLTVEFPAFSFSSDVVSNSLSVMFPIYDANFSALSGSVSSLGITFKSFSTSFASKIVAIEASAISVSSEGFVYQVPSLNVDTSSITISADGDISGSITIVQPDPDTESDNDLAFALEGDVYIVLNLKTKSHTTYRDGNNNAIAKTGELTFSSLKEKNVSDAYISARSTGDVRLISKNAENTERTHDLVFQVDDDANLKNKKIRLAKGLRGTNWQFSISSSDGDNLEIRSIDLIVNELKRRV